MKQIIFVVLLMIATVSSVYAQNDASIDEIEGLFAEEEEQTVRRDERELKQIEAKKQEKKVEEMSDLKRLETFSDIAVIQKRFLPKTGRFEFYVSGATNLNDAFFVGNGVGARFGYYFREKWGIEGVFSHFQNQNRDVTNELLTKGVNTEGSVSTDGYVGLDLKWTPIFGKFAYFNNKIIPFDLYFTVGVGQTTPRIAESALSSRALDVVSPYTIKFGTGQIFAITKWMAFRWDLSMHMINTETTVTEGSVSSTNSAFNNNLFLNVGLSFFFPEAKYR
jgi:outer membrane beta-barrel protein